METKKDLVYVEIDSGVEDIKLYYIFEIPAEVVVSSLNRW